MNSVDNITSKTKLIMWSTWFVASIFFAYQYILRVMPSVIMQDLMQQFNLDAVLFGQFSGIYYIGYAAAHLPLGLLLDRYGTKKIMPTCILLAISGTLPIIFAKNWVIAVVGRLFVGIGSSGAILSAFKVIYSGFGPEKFTRMLSFTITIGLLGAIYGGAPLNYLCTIFDYKSITIILVAIGIVLSIIAYVITPECQAKNAESILYNAKEVLCNKMILIVCCLAGFMVGPLEGFADLWGKQFLEFTYALDSNVAAGLSSALFLGTCFGSVLLSYIAARINNDSLTIFMAASVMAIGFIILLLGVGNVVTLGITLAIIGGCCTYQTYAIFKASTYVSERAVGLTTAVANMIIMLFGYAFHTTLGIVINANGGSASASALKSGIAIIPVGLVLGALGFLAIYWQENKLVKSIAI